MSSSRLSSRFLRRFPFVTRIATDNAPHVNLFSEGTDHAKTFVHVLDRLEDAIRSNDCQASVFQLRAALDCELPDAASPASVPATKIPEIRVHLVKCYRLLEELARTGGEIQASELVWNACPVELSAVGRKHLERLGDWPKVIEDASNVWAKKPSNPIQAVTRFASSAAHLGHIKTFCELTSKTKASMLATNFQTAALVLHYLTSTSFGHGVIPAIPERMQDFDVPEEQMQSMNAIWEKAKNGKGLELCIIWATHISPLCLFLPLVLYKSNFSLSDIYKISLGLGGPRPDILRLVEEVIWKEIIALAAGQKEPGQAVESALQALSAVDFSSADIHKNWFLRPFTPQALDTIVQPVLAPFSSAAHHVSPDSIPTAPVVNGLCPMAVTPCVGSDATGAVAKIAVKDQVHAPSFSDINSISPDSEPMMASPILNDGLHTVTNIASTSSEPPAGHCAPTMDTISTSVPEQLGLGTCLTSRPENSSTVDQATSQEVVSTTMLIQLDVEMLDATSSPIIFPDSEPMMVSPILSDLHLMTDAASTSSESRAGPGTPTLDSLSTSVTEQLSLGTSLTARPVTPSSEDQVTSPISITMPIRPDIEMTDSTDPPPSAELAPVTESTGTAIELTVNIRPMYSAYGICLDESLDPWMSGINRHVLQDVIKRVTNGFLDNRPPHLLDPPRFTSLRIMEAWPSSPQSNPRPGRSFAEVSRALFGGFEVRRPTLASSIYQAQTRPMSLNQLSRGKGLRTPWLALPFDSLPLPDQVGCDFYAWRATEGGPECRGGEEYPTSKLLSAMAFSPGATMAWQTPEAGCGTRLTVPSGRVWCVWTGFGDDILESCYILTRKERYGEDSWFSDCEVEAIVLDPSVELYLRPGVSYFLVALEASFCIRRQFYCVATLRRSLAAVVQGHWSDFQSPSESHFFLLRRLLYFIHGGLVAGGMDIESRIPSPTEIPDLEDILALIALLLLEPSMASVSPEPIEGVAGGCENDSDGEVDEADAMWARTFNESGSLKVEKETRKAYARGICWELLDFISKAHIETQFPGQHHNALDSYLATLIWQLHTADNALRHSNDDDFLKRMICSIAGFKMELLDALKGVAREAMVNGESLVHIGAWLAKPLLCRSESHIFEINDYSERVKMGRLLTS
ncbi:hypothetical protein GALMADRAFT_148752 [Galerina marginata CBS 339.88]|uniref:Uncharacterized protein n=1 Tax=Galerina marginata (strain CBS 339.88) TaxID=685588 RepID=A0A067S3I0_GALM3|nr:hypothetical protein GALMADRAFT_148752 [Galerina marginata CBS 339.88]